MHRKCEHGGIVAENGRSAVALMHVAIDHDGAADQTVTEQHARRDRDVVEHAVSLATVGERVMSAACQVCRKGERCRTAGLHCDDLSSSGDRCADRSARTLDHFWRPRKADAPLRMRVERSPHDRIHIRALVDEQQVVQRRGSRNAQPGCVEHSVCEQTLAQQPVLRHRKTMMVRQRQHEGVGVERFH